jgi:hypothetical protein
MPDFADLAIDYHQRHVALNAAVHHVDNVHMGDEERCLRRQDGSQSREYGNQRERAWKRI